MSAILDKIPFVPKLTKFLVCLDLYQGVRMTSIGETLHVISIEVTFCFPHPVLAILWIIYAVVGFFKFATGQLSIVLRYLRRLAFIFYI